MKSIWIVLFFISCMTWRKANLGIESSWSNNSDVLIYRIEFEERNSWNPLEGTTLKRNFKTKLEEYKLINENLQKQSEFEFPFWVLTNSLFYNFEKKLLFFIRGQENSGYGTENRIISIYKIENKSLENIWNSKEGEYLWKIVPAPDATKLVFITTESATSELNAKLQVWDGKLRSVKISSWLDASFEHAISWSEDSKSIYLAQPDGVYEISLLDQNLSLKKASQFPKCFIPSTSFGFRISKEGKEIQQNSENRTKYNIVVHDKFIPFGKIPKTNQFQNRECEFNF